MKVVVKSFSKSVEEFANVDSWSDKELANKLNEVLKNPKNPDAKSIEAKSIAKDLGIKADSMKSLYQAIKSDKSLRDKFLNTENIVANKPAGTILGSPEKIWRGEKVADYSGAPTDYELGVSSSEGFFTIGTKKARLNNTVKEVTKAMKNLEYTSNARMIVRVRDWGDGAAVTVTIYVPGSTKRLTSQIYLKEWTKDAELNVHAPNDSHPFSFKNPGSANKRTAWNQFYKIMRPFFSELFKMQF